jgi:hypothetical protein
MCPAGGRTAANFAATITELRWNGSSGTLSEAKIG